MGNTWKVVVAFVGVFVAGTVFGGFFALGVGQRMIESRRPALPPTDPMLLQRYVQQLNLTEEQTTRIKPILDKVQKDVNEIRRQATLDTAAVLRPIVEKAEIDLKKLLTPEQLTKLGDIQKNRSLSLDNQGRGGRPGGPQPGSSFDPNRRGGPNNFIPGGRGQRGPGGQGGGFNPGGVRSGGFTGQPPLDPKNAKENPTVSTTPAAPAN